MRLNGITAIAGILVVAMAAPSFPAAEEPMSQAVKQGFDKGFHDCAKAADRAVKYIHKDDSSYANLTLWGEKPNDHALAIITSEAYKDGNQTTTFSAVKTRDGKCDVIYTQIVPTQESCVQVRESSYKDWKYDDDLSGTSTFENPANDAFTVLLVNLPESHCLIVEHLLADGVDP